MKAIAAIEKAVVVVLMVLMLLVVMASTVEVSVLLFTGLTNETPGRLDLPEVLPLLGGLMLILIGIELLHTVKIYLSERHLHVEVVVLVAMIAIARKVIILDYKDVSPGLLFGLAALFLSLAAGYFLLTREPRARSRTDSTAPSA